MADILFLFSSNIRPLYEQDILNVVAAPNGLEYRFRYREDYVAPGARGEWASLAGTTALIQYSLQQPNRYHEPVFIPVRTAKVRRAYVEAGAFYVVELELGGSVALPEAKRTAEPEYSYAQAVRDWRAFLEARKISMPYESWASIGPNVLTEGNAPMELGKDLEGDARLFIRTTKYLSGVVTLGQARFYRALGIFERSAWTSGQREPLPFNPESSAIHLEAGKAYVLGILHSQPTEREGVSRIQVTSDEDVVQLVGGGSVEIASAYDVVGVPLHAPQISPEVYREGVIRMAADEGITAPRLVLPVRNQQGTARMVAGISTAAGGLLLLGLPALLTTVPVELRVGSLLVGIFAAVLGQYFLSGRIISAK